MSKFLEVINKRKKHFDKKSLIMGSDTKELLAATLEGVQEIKQGQTKCPSCNRLLNNKELIKNYKVCYCCNHHFRINSLERVEFIFDSGSIQFFDEDLVSGNPIEFPNYEAKLEQLKENLKINEAVITGKGTISNEIVYFGVMDFRFIMGSMGSVVGEKLTRMIERAAEAGKPIVIFSSSGGARMQEGMISLYQMAKVVAAVEKHSQKGLLYISILTDPTTGGVIASFASTADIIIAEPNATIGFAGKRVIKNTIKDKDSSEFQTSEYHFNKGHIDIICERRSMKKLILGIINLYFVKLKNKSQEIQYEIDETEDMENFSRANLSAWERVKLARHPNRANFQDYIKNIFDDFIELHGDRISKDDQAVITGVGSINGIAVTAVFNAKGKSLEENKTRNFGMTGPEGYRKVVRIIKLSEKFGLPVICFIDTPGAYCGVEAEQMGQSYAIANSIRNFTKLKVPVISIITGEGGSGGALAIGVADWIFILENSIYSVISPEGCASILFKDSSKAEVAAEHLKLTAEELLRLNIVDEIISEPQEGFDGDLEILLKHIGVKLYNKLIELLKLETDELLSKRNSKFRNKGVYSSNINKNE